MARVLFTTLGSYGDLYPYLAIGVCLRQLGHSVTICTSASFEEKITSQGLDFAPMRPDVDLDNREMMAYLFHQRLGTERVLRGISSVARESYDDTVEAASKADVAVTHPITFASVLAVRKLGIPWISSVLAPISLLSAYQPPVPAPFPGIVRLRALGPRVMQAIWNIGKRASLSWVQPILDLERELGLPPSGHPLFEGANSPNLVLALFSRLFAEPQPDWPSHTILTGFPFHNSAGTAELAPELEAFFGRGPAPVVFTLGSSAVGAAGQFYADSLQAVRSLNARALFLTGAHPQGLPGTLPDTVMTWSYAPHGPVFARAAAIVHQGGIGTTSQALASGHPSLVVPFAHDQFDNADRVRKMGAGLSLPRAKYNPRSAAGLLKRLLDDPAHRSAADAVGAKLRTENGAQSAANAIHAFVATSRRS